MSITNKLQAFFIGLFYLLISPIGTVLAFAINPYIGFIQSCAMMVYFIFIIALLHNTDYEQ